MAQLFETKIRYDKIQENGAVKKVTEAYLVDALSFTEAEARIIEEMTPYISGEFSVVAIKRTKIAEVFWNPEAEKWWTVKVNFITLDDKTGVEKKSASLILVQADDDASAREKFNEGMRGTMADYSIISMSETAIIEVYGK